MKHTDCRFGKWYFGEGMAMFKDLSVFVDIQGAHKMVHAVYEQIYNLVKKHDSTAAQGKLNQMIDISRSLLEDLAFFEQETEAHS